jgi:hypothetical protein
MTDENVMGFKLELVGRFNPAKSKAVPGNESIVEGKRRDQEAGRKLANEYAQEAFLAIVSTMRTTTDENVRLRCADKIMNRAWGLAKAVSEEERKGADSHSLLDVLAAFSGTQANLERGTPEAPAISHETTIDNDQSTTAFLDELQRQRGGDIVDGELVSD